MTIHYVSVDDLRGLEIIEIYLRNDDKIVFIQKLPQPANVGTIVLDTPVKVKDVAPEQKPNRGPQGNVEPWKRRGKN